jgi:hypothetical protein
VKHITFTANHHQRQVSLSPSEDLAAPNASDSQRGAWTAIRRRRGIRVAGSAEGLSQPARLRAENAIDRRAPYAEPLGDLGSAQALRLQCGDLGSLDRCRATLVDAARLSRVDAFQLAFLAKVRLEFREDAEHVEKGLAGGRRGVNRLLC